MSRPFYTVGHSNRSLEELTGILADAGIELLADVRKVPGSRAHPQFDEDALAASLPRAGIRYERLAALGGRRSAAREMPRELNGFWENRSFHNYADYASSDEFRHGLDRLLEWGRDLRVAVMCSEAVWWRCHRRIIADHLLARGEEVLHLMGRGRIEPARLTSGAMVHPDRSVTYPLPPVPS